MAKTQFTANFHIWETEFWGSYTLVVAPMGVKFGTEEGTECQISPPSVQCVAPAGRKTSKLASE